MKNTFTRISYVLMLLVITKSNAQESPSFKITPELSKQIIEKYQLEDFEIYSVTSKDIEYYPYVEGEVLTNQYKAQLRIIEEYKPDYDKYINEAIFNSEKKDAINSISKTIDDFLNSNDKYEIKEKLLISAQELASKYNISVSIVDNRPTLKSVLTKTTYSSYDTNAPERVILLYEQNKKTSKNDLKIFKEEIQKIQILEPEKTNGFREYQERSRELSMITKTETARVLSDKLSTKSVYVIADTPLNVNILSGEFVQLKDDYSLIKTEINGKFVKNQLITIEDHRYYNVRNLEFNGLPIIKKSNSNELYYVENINFIFQLEKLQENANYEKLGNTTEYKTWKAKYVNLMKSCNVNINVCNAIIAKHTFKNRLGQKRYDSSDFSKEEKITFNKNLDSLQSKLNQIRELENNNTFTTYYNDHASTAESVESYSLSTYYNSTNRAY